MPLFSLGRKADQTIHLAPGNYQYLRGLERIVMKAIGADRRRQTMTRHLENQLFTENNSSRMQTNFQRFYIFGIIPYH